MNKVVTIETKDIDRDDRTIGDVFHADDTNLNRELIQEGLAWWFFKYSKDETLKNLEMEAREEKRGLWRDPFPIPHWFSQTKRAMCIATRRTNSTTR